MEAEKKPEEITKLTKKVGYPKKTKESIKKTEFCEKLALTKGFLKPEGLEKKSKGNHSKRRTFAQLVESGSEKLDFQSPNEESSLCNSPSEETKGVYRKAKPKSEYELAVDYVNLIKELEWEECNPETNKNSPCKIRSL